MSNGHGRWEAPYRELVDPENIDVKSNLKDHRVLAILMKIERFAKWYGIEELEEFVELWLRRVTSVEGHQARLMVEAIKAGVIEGDPRIDEAIPGETEEREPRRRVIPDRDGDGDASEAEDLGGGAVGLKDA